MDKSTLVRKANLNYEGAVPRSEEGLPVGNGTMGTLVWTSPASVKMAVNRVDVFANGNATNSFIETHEDYAYACGFVDIDLAGYGEDVFDKTTRETLDIYDAKMSIQSHGIEMEGFMAAQKDVMALRFQDSRQQPQGVEVRLRMLRSSVVRRRSHVAVSSLKKIGDVAVLLQEFIEDDFYCASAVAVKTTGRSPIVRMDNENGGDHPVLPPSHTTEMGRESETDMYLRLAPEKGTFHVYISSATTMDRNEDIVAKAAKLANDAAREGYDALLLPHLDWWHHFWEKSYVSIWGTPEAEEASVHYTYFFYIMACCSRNEKYAPNFGGMNLSPRGDHRHWGAMQWWNNLNLYYNAILPSGHRELIEPYFNMYFNMYEASETAARQVWGAEGIYIGETTYVWGPEKLPDSIADELRELMLMRKPWSERSEAFEKFARRKNAFEPRWNWLIGKNTDSRWVNGELEYEDTECGPISHISHIFGSMANLAYQYWLCYEYTGDEDFLREKAYPMLRGIAEFFRTYPNTVKEDDGLYHVLYTNHNECFWGGKDTLDTMTGMHGILRTVIHAARLLDVDQDKLPLWEELLEHLAPLPTSKDTVCPVEMPEDGSEIFVGARGHAFYRENVTASPDPCLRFDFCNLQTAKADPHMYEVGKNTVEMFKRHYEKGDHDFGWEMSGFPRIFAAMGEGDILCDNIIKQIRAEMAASEHCFFVENGSQNVYRNRLTAREGINAMSAQRLGNVAAGIQMGLMQSSGGAPTLPPVIRVFPAWKQSWNAEFELYAKGGLLVHARCVNGYVEFVKVTASRDAHLALINPWKNGACSEKALFMEEEIHMDLKAGESVEFHENTERR